MDVGTILGIVIGIVIIAIGVWSAPPDNVSEKMKKMSDEERKKRETKNVVFTLFQFFLSPIMLIIYFILALFFSTI